MWQIAFISRVVHRVIMPEERARLPCRLGYLLDVRLVISSAPTLECLCGAVVKRAVGVYRESEQHLLERPVAGVPKAGVGHGVDSGRGHCLTFMVLHGGD